jgi:phage terminase large subunit GpA-like protein
VTRFHKGFPRREYIKTRPRNDALDCRVYAMAAFAILNMNINRLADRMAQQKTEPEAGEPMSVAEMQQRAPAKRGRGGGGNWATEWR